MKRFLALSACFALAVLLSGCAGTYSESGPPPATNYPSGGSRISLDYFYENLSQDGAWFPDRTYGWCWTPYDVSPEWRPYYDGRWEYTDYGWSWASNESFGWATYHYGRWFFDDSYGWAWVPGTEWAPAWVAWRSSDDWVGWAPLPPTATWDASSGLSYRDEDAIPSNRWCFVPQNQLFETSINLRVSSVGHNVTLLERSRDATRYGARSGRPANLGIDITRFEASLGRAVPRMKIVDVGAPAGGSGRPVAGGVGYYRPAVQAPPPDRAPAPAMTRQPGDVPDAVLQRERDQGQRKLESELAAEQQGLARDQENELRTQAPGAAVEDARKRHLAEQQAFEAHAAQQRQVFAQRMQKQLVRPDPADRPGRGHGKDHGKDKGNDKGKGDQ